MNYLSFPSREYFTHATENARRQRIQAYLRHSPVLELIESLSAWADPELTKLWATFGVLNTSRHFHPMPRKDYDTLRWLGEQIARTDAPMPALRKWWAETQEMTRYVDPA